eukprot:5848787-Amphidinium_carterae.2
MTTSHTVLYTPQQSRLRRATSQKKNTEGSERGVRPPRQTEPFHFMRALLTQDTHNLPGTGWRGSERSWSLF